MRRSLLLGAVLPEHCIASRHGPQHGCPMVPALCSLAIDPAIANVKAKADSAIGRPWL